MKLWSRLPSILMILLALSVGGVFLPSLSGCAVNDSPVGRWMSALTGVQGLPRAAMEDLARFKEVYDVMAVADDTLDDEFDHFVEAFKVVRRSYVTPVSDQDLITYAIDGLKTSDQAWLSEDDGSPKGQAVPAKVVEVALDAMMAKLDPHSGFMTAPEFQELMVDTSGEFGGLGIEVQQGDGFLKVVSPIEDTPADRAGLQPGDRITHIEGESIHSWTLVRTVRRLRGKPGTGVTVTVDRDEREPFEITIIRDIIQVKAVRYALYDDILHVRVVSFSERMEGDVRKAFDNARKELGHDLKGVVLDLRNNPGGLLQQSVALSEMFLDGGTVVSVRGRDEKDVRNYGADSGELAAGLPVVVLINGGSASASEIVSGALQDRNRAILMGRRTFGKGSVQTIMPLIHDGAVRLTTALYYLPSGRTIQKVGVAPDIRLDLPKPKEEAANDNMPAADEDKDQTAFNAPREADLPNVLNAREIAENTHDTDGALGRASVESCPEIGDKKDRELGCALEFLKAGSAKKFLASVGVKAKG